MTDPTPAVAPYVPTYASTEPYVTKAEFNAYPTGINASQLVPGGNAQLNSDTLDQILLNASGMADGICQQTLACTLEVQTGLYRVQKGRLLIPSSQVPLVQVNAVSAGSSSNQQPLQSFDGATFPSPNIFSVPYAGWTDGGEVAATMTYIAGYPNTLLAAAAAQGASTILVNDTLGMQVGLQLRIADPGKTENITITAIDPLTGTLTLAKPLAAAHDLGTSCSALPAAIKQAVILLACVLIKIRATQAIVLQSIAGNLNQRDIADPTAGQAYKQAELLLNPFVRVA